MRAAGTGPLPESLKRLFAVLASPEFLCWTIGSWVIYYVSSMIWAKESFAYFMQKLGSSLFFQVPFVLFLVSGYLNLLRSAASRSGQRSWRSLLFLVLPLGLLLYGTGFFVGATSRHFEWLVVKSGEFIQPKWSPEQHRIEMIRPGVRESFLDTDLENNGGLFKYEPQVTVSNREGKTFVIGAFPPAKLGNTYFHVLNFGLAPGISFSENGEEKVRDYVTLRILGPGSNDTFELQPLPYKFLISLEPEQTPQKGAQKAAEYNLRSPRYRVRVLEGEKVIAEAVSKDGIAFNNMALGFFEPGYWVQLEAVKDRGVPLVVSGIFLVLAGVPAALCGLLLGLRRKSISPKNAL